MALSVLVALVALLLANGPVVTPQEVTIGPESGAETKISLADGDFTVKFSPSIPPGITVTNRYGDRCPRAGAGVACKHGATPYTIHWPAITDRSLGGTRFTAVVNDGQRSWAFATVVFPPPPTAEPPSTTAQPPPTESEPGPPPTTTVPVAEPTAEPAPEPTPSPTLSAAPAIEPDPPGGIPIEMLAWVGSAGMLAFSLSAVGLWRLRRRSDGEPPTAPEYLVDGPEAPDEYR